jgi:hypothetical protein
MLRRNLLSNLVLVIANKRKRFNKSLVEKRNLDFNLLVQSMGMNAMYQRVISVGKGVRNSAGFWAKNDSIPPDLKCGFTLIFEVEVQKPGGIAPLR